jgi:hypothetical protein
MVVEISQPGVKQPVRQLGLPLKLSRTRGSVTRMPAPALGQHTEEVLKELRLSHAEVSELLRSGAVAGASPGPLAQDGGFAASETDVGFAASGQDVGFAASGQDVGFTASE